MGLVGRFAPILASHEAEIVRKSLHTRQKSRGAGGGFSIEQMKVNRSRVETHSSQADPLNTTGGRNSSLKKVRSVNQNQTINNDLHTTLTWFDQKRRSSETR